MYNWSSSTVGIATTADPVSWVAGKMTLHENPISSSISLLKSPTIVPGSEISPKIFSGYPRRLIKSKFQSFVFGFNSCVVVAFVYSVFLTPVNKKLK